MKSQKLAMKFAGSFQSKHAKNYATEIVLHRTGGQISVPIVPSEMTFDQAHSICAEVDRILRN